MVHMGRYPGQVALRTARPAWLCLSIAGLALAGCTQGGTPAGIGLRPSAHAGSAAIVPRPGRTVVVVLENHASATSLAVRGPRTSTRSRARALSSPPPIAADLFAAGLSFAGYAQGLPAPGSQACDYGDYARKHAPWTDCTDVPRTANQPFSRFVAVGH